MNSNIRHYQDKDLNDLLIVWESASRLAHPFLSEPFIEQERLNIPNMYLPNADTWVATKDGNLVGFIALIGNEVGAIFVSPDCHGQGVGKTLMDKASALYPVLELDVFKENRIGRKFYDRYGFTLMNEKVFEATGDTVLRLIYKRIAIK